MQGSQHHDEMYVSAISNTNMMWEFNITLRKIQAKGEKVYKSPAQIKKQFNPVNETKSQEIGREDLFNKKYRNMLNVFEYIVEGENWINLNETLGDDVKPKQMIFYMNRGEKYYILSDEKGYLSVFYRGLSLKARFYTGEDEIVQILKQSLTVMVVHKHDIRFVRFYRSSIGSKKWHSGLAELTNIAVDTNHNGFVYGATNAGEILMFKTERLLQNVDNISCYIQGKLKVPVAKSLSRDIKVVSVKNYLIAFKSDGNLQLFDLTNLPQFLNKPIGYDIKLPSSNSIVPFNQLLKIRTIKSFNGDLILLNFLPKDSSNKAILYECITPVLIDSESENAMNFRFPMFFIVFIIILIFQFANRKNKKKADLFSMILSCCGIGDDEPVFKNKKERDLHEIEKMVRNYTVSFTYLNNLFIMIIYRTKQMNWTKNWLNASSYNLWHFNNFKN